MKGKEFSIEVDDYIFHCVVTSYVYQRPLGPSADSDWDCYGYEEVEWDCNCVEVYDEDGYLVETTVDVDKYSENIEEKILDEIHEMQEEDYY